MVSTHANGAAFDAQAVLDYIGVGFGPSNLALAVALEERSERIRGVFVESHPRFQWHPGMMLDGSRMQVSFLKDVVTLRNPASKYSFLQYLKAQGRLERFINLRQFFPTRVEYQEYLTWVAERFEHQVRYGRKVRRVTICPSSSQGRQTHVYCVEIENLADGSFESLKARNVVYAPGGMPNVLAGVPRDCPAVVHSSRFLHDFIERFPDTARAYRFAVIGGGQSAAEIAKYLLENYREASVHLGFPQYALRPSDSSPFVNEVFFSNERDRMYALADDEREAVLAETRNTNYGVVDPDLLSQLYGAGYLDAIKGKQRLHLHSRRRLREITWTGSCARVTLESPAQDATVLDCDGVILATGYVRAVDEEIFADLLPLMARSRDGSIALSRGYRVDMDLDAEGDIFFQGLSERSHGVGDSLLSQLAFRAGEIAEHLCVDAGGRHAEPTAGESPRIEMPAQSLYPPVRHVEHDIEKLYAVMTRFPFATMVSVRDNAPLVTQLPLILDRDFGEYGVLFGHMDRNNPHLGALDGSDATIVFHGPNVYISPNIYTTSQLPTWNSISVHVRGHVRLLRDQDRLVRGLQSICECADPGPGTYRLPADEPRIPKLIDFIVGFEIEITSMVGRFKISQDRNQTDRAIAMDAMMQRCRAGEDDFLRFVADLEDSAMTV